MANGVPDISLEAEQALLGALLADEAMWDEVADLVQPTIFGVQAHRVVAEVVVDRLARKQPVDPILVATALEQAGKLGTLVPRDLPLQLTRSTGTTSNARHYALTVHGLWQRREVKAVARELAADESEAAGAALAARFAERLSAIETAAARPARRLDTLVSEALDRLEEQNKAALTGRVMASDRIPTGFGRYDALTGGIIRGHLTLICARPSVGKTAFASALADNCAAHGTGVHIFQLEDYGDALARRAIARRARISSTLLRDGSGWTSLQWTRALAASMPLPIWVDDQHGLTPLDVVGRMRRAKREHPEIGLFMLDVLRELDVERGLAGPRGADDRLDRLIGKGASLIRDTAHALGVGFVVYHHLKRDVEARRGRARFADIKNSGELEEAAHTVAFVDRPDDEDRDHRGQFWIDVAKNRDGPTGRVTLRWLEDYMSVENPPDPTSGGAAVDGR